MHKCKKHPCPKPETCKCRTIRSSKVPIIWLIGGAGAGKNTQSMKIGEKYDLNVIHVGSIFRAEVDSGSAKGIELENYLTAGRLVPDDQVMDIIEPILRRKLKKTKNGFVIVSFPKSEPQSELFEKFIAPVDMILHLNCAEEVMMARVVQRSEEAGVNSRREDNEQTARLRIELFNDVLPKIVAKYGSKVQTINGELTVDQVFDAIVPLIDAVIAEKLKEKEDTTTGCC